MPDLSFILTVKDDGSVVVKNFADKTKKQTGRAANATERGSKRMRAAFTKLRKTTAAAERGFQRFTKAATSLRGLLLGGLGIAGIVIGLKSIVSAALEDEDAVRKLNFALKLTDDFTVEASAGMQMFASSLQDTTGTAGDVTLTMLALAKSFGTTNEQAQILVEAGINFAVAANLNLEEAVRRLGRAISGSVDDVSKFVPGIKELTKEQLRAGEAAELILKRFGGAAQAQIEGFSGEMIKLKNTFGDFLVEIGKVITQSPKAQQALQDFAAVFKDPENIDAVVRFGDLLLRLAFGALEFSSNVIIATERAGELLGLIKESAPAIAAEVEQFKQLIDAVISSEEGFNNNAIALIEFDQTILKTLGLDILSEKMSEVSEEISTLEDNFLGSNIRLRAARQEQKRLAQAIDLVVLFFRIERQVLAEAAEAADMAGDAFDGLRASAMGAVPEMPEDGAEDRGPGLLGFIQGINQSIQDLAISGVENIGTFVGETLVLLDEWIQKMALVGQAVEANRQAVEFAEAAKKRAIGAATSAIVGSFIDQAIAGEVSGRALVASAAQAVSGVLKSIAQEAAVQAIFNLAKGIGAAASGNAAAAGLFFKAAGSFAATAAAAGAGAIVAGRTAGAFGGAPGATGFGFGGPTGPFGGPGGGPPTGPTGGVPSPPAPGRFGVPIMVEISVSGFVGDEALLASKLGDIFREAVGDDVDFGLTTGI